MARQAEFLFSGKSIKAELKKVDRKKIYGWSTIEVYDENGSKCSLAGLSEGSYVMPSGSSSLVSLNSKGETVSKNTLVGVNLDGEKVEKVPSIYDQKVILREASIDEYLSMAVKTVYQLNIEENKEALLGELNEGKIYYFVFNYIFCSLTYFIPTKFISMKLPCILAHLFIFKRSFNSPHYGLRNPFRF